MKEENPTVPGTYIDEENALDTDIPAEEEPVPDTEFPAEAEPVPDTDIPAEAEPVHDTEYQTVHDTEYRTVTDTETRTVTDTKTRTVHNTETKTVTDTETRTVRNKKKSRWRRKKAVSDGEPVPGAEVPAEGKAPTPAEKMEKRVRRYEHSVRDYQFFVLRLLLLLIMLWVMFFKVIGVMRMPSTDMYPRIDAGDILLFYRLDTDVHAQDVVALQKVTPEGEAEVFVGRVVAIAGDTVDIDTSGRLRVNGNNMIESNIFYDTYPYEGYAEFPMFLYPGQYFILSDYRDGGSDSRYYGPVEMEELLGTVITVLRRNNL